MPNMRVFRPCDAIETAECWELALERIKGPTRAGADPPEPAAACATNAASDNLCADGAYELSPRRGRRRVSLFASGSEVEHRGRRPSKPLAERGIAARVVSVPSLDLLLRAARRLRRGQ